MSWSLDLSGGIQRVALMHGCVPYGNGKARMDRALPDPIPVHREPIYTPRVDLVAKYQTLPDAKQFRMPNIGFSVQKTAVERGIADNFRSFSLRAGLQWRRRRNAHQTVAC